MPAACPVRRDADPGHDGRAVHEQRHRPAAARGRAAHGRGPRLDQHRDAVRSPFLGVAAGEAVGAERQQGGRRAGAAPSGVARSASAAGRSSSTSTPNSRGDVGDGGAGLGGVHQLGEGGLVVPGRVRAHRLGGGAGAADGEPAPARRPRRAPGKAGPKAIVTLVPAVTSLGPSSTHQRLAGARGRRRGRSGRRGSRPRAGRRSPGRRR